MSISKISPAPLYHLIGIGGTAMASLAGLLRGLGFRVQGSDGPIYPPMSGVLAAMDVTVFEGYDPAQLWPAPDRVVVGNAISRGNVELEAVLDRDLPYCSMSALLFDAVLRERQRLVVSGTHGKTTTTSLAAWLLFRAGREPGWMIGGQPLDLPSNQHWGRAGGAFVVEGDEYDTAYYDKAPKFFHYRPQRLVVNAVEFDHADIYDSLEAIELQFRRLVNIVPSSGRIAVCGDDAGAQRVVASASSELVTFGIGARPAKSRGEPDFWVPEWSERDDGLDFQLRIRGQAQGEWRLGVLGDFNLRNAVAALALVEGLGGTAESNRSALAEFHGVRRRLELRGRPAGVAVYDDFAHHPTAVAGSVESLRKKKEGGGRLIAIVEPRSWTLRRRIFEAELSTALVGADLALVAPVYRPDRLDDEIRMDPRRVVAGLEAQGGRGEAPESIAAIIERVVSWARPGDRVLVMSNGGFEALHDRLIAALDEARGG